MNQHDHFELIRRRLLRHEDFKYQDALPFFEAALEECSGCPNAAYNKANTLHMLGRDDEAIEIFSSIVDTPEDVLREGCPDLYPSPRSLILDSYHMLFLATLEATGSWKIAVPFLRKHMGKRSRGLVSLWSKATVVEDAEKLRKQYAPRSRSVRQLG